MSIRILEGDCRDVLRTLPDASVHSIVTDPPYELTSARPGGRSEATRGKVMGGFMGMKWDGSGVAFDPEVWRECLRVLKPGGHLLSFGGSRTYHRMACAIEDAGLEIRDQIMWIYASGFPKSHNLDNRKGKDFCGCESKTECDVRPLPIGDVSPAVNVGEESRQVLQQGVPECSISASGRSELSSSQVRTREPSVEGRRDAEKGARELQGGSVRPLSGLGDANGEEGRLRDGASACDGEAVRILADADGGCRSPRSQPREQSANEPLAVSDECGPQARGAWPICPRCCKPRIPDGLGTALKPAHEPIVVARKPLIGTVSANVQAHGTGALNIDGCRIHADDALGGAYTVKRLKPGATLNATGGNWRPESDDAATYEGEMKPGRWPANVMHDGSEEVLACFPAQAGQQSAVRGTEPSECHSNIYCGPRERQAFQGHGDSGSAARFFYCAKASAADRNVGGADNTHPTVKPTELMRYLVRLVTPPGGTVLDPFAGSGTTGRACDIDGFDAILIELLASHVAIAKQRISGDAPLFCDVA